MPEEVKRSTLQRFKGLPNRWNLNGFHCLGISRHPSKIKDKLLYLAPPATEEEQCWVACFMLQKQYIPYLSIISVSFIMWNRSFEWSLEQEDTLLQGQATVKATLPLPPCNLTALVVPKITYLWGRKKLGGPAMHPSRKFAAQNKGQSLTVLHVRILLAALPTVLANSRFFFAPAISSAWNTPSSHILAHAYTSAYTPLYCESGMGSI